MKRVTGIGGIFFKCQNPDSIKTWYKKHLGFDTDEWGTNFEWRLADNPEQKGYTQWSPFSNDSDYFKPSERDFMINYRVDNLTALVEQLRQEGVQILDDIQTFPYGKFIHLLDPEGNAIELWEPKDVEYEKIIEGKTK